MPRPMTFTEADIKRILLTAVENTREACADICESLAEAATSPDAALGARICAKALRSEVEVRLVFMGRSEDEPS